MQSKMLTVERRNVVEFESTVRMGRLVKRTTAPDNEEGVHIQLSQTLFSDRFRTALIVSGILFTGDVSPLGYPLKRVQKSFDIASMDSEEGRERSNSFDSFPEKYGNDDEWEGGIEF